MEFHFGCLILSALFFFIFISAPIPLMIDKLRAVAAHISEFNSKVADEARFIRANYGIKKSEQDSVSFDGALEEGISIPVNGTKINGKVCAVDSGLLSSELHGIDIAVCRPACSCFSYSNSKVVSSDYFPSRVPESVIDVRIGLDHSEAQIFRQLFRLEQEISCAISVAEKLHPNILFLDGSILPLPSDRPGAESELSSLYSELIHSYVRLYSICEKEKILLIGLSKDSRGRRFVDSIKPHLSSRASDAVFLNHLLAARERTFSMSYSQFPKKHLILRDIGISDLKVAGGSNFADKLNLFYIKCVEGDYPLRVEFLSYSGTGASAVAPIVLSLSAINKNYAYPAVLIDADLKAMLDPLELERVQKALMDLSPNSIRQMRRNARPFR